MSDPIREAILVMAASGGRDLSRIDLRDGAGVVRHLCNIVRPGEAAKCINAMNRKIELLAGDNPCAACFLLDGLQLLASEEMLHHVYDGAEFFFAELSESDLLKLTEYTAPFGEDAPSEGYLRWLGRLNTRRAGAFRDESV